MNIAPDTLCQSVEPPDALCWSADPPNALCRSTEPPDALCWSADPPNTLCRSTEPPDALCRSTEPSNTLCRSTEPPEMSDLCRLHADRTEVLCQMQAAINCHNCQHFELSQRPLIHQLLHPEPVCFRGFSATTTTPAPPPTPHRGDSTDDWWICDGITNKCPVLRATDYRDSPLFGTPAQKLPAVAQLTPESRLSPSQHQNHACRPANTRITPVIQPTPESRLSPSRHQNHACHKPTPESRLSPSQHQNHACHPANTIMTPVTQPTPESRLSPSQHRNHACHPANTGITPVIRPTPESRVSQTVGAAILTADKASQPGVMAIMGELSQKQRGGVERVSMEKCALTTFYFNITSVRISSANSLHIRRLTKGGLLPSAGIVRQQSVQLFIPPPVSGDHLSSTADNTRKVVLPIGTIALLSTGVISLLLVSFHCYWLITATCDILLLLVNSLLVVIFHCYWCHFATTGVFQRYLLIHCYWCYSFASTCVIPCFTATCVTRLLLCV